MEFLASESFFCSSFICSQLILIRRQERLSLDITSLGGYCLCSFYRWTAARQKNLVAIQRAVRRQMIALDHDPASGNCDSVASSCLPSHRQDTGWLDRRKRRRQGWRSAYLAYVLELPCCGRNSDETRHRVDNQSLKSPVALEIHGSVFCDQGAKVVDVVVRLRMSGKHSYRFIPYVF